MYLAGTKQKVHEIRKKKCTSPTHKLPVALLPHAMLAFRQKAQSISDPTCVNQSSFQSC